MKSKIIITRGIPASGKSTYACNWVNENPEKRIRINFDDIRMMLGGKFIENYWILSREKAGFCEAVLRALLINAVIKGYDVIIDNMNLSPRMINLIKDCLKDFSDDSFEIEYVNFPTPVEVCIERDKKRERPIGEKTIRKLYNKNKWIYNEEMGC